MSKLGESLLRGAHEALAHAKGKKIKAKAHKVLVPKLIDVRAVKLYVSAATAKLSHIFIARVSSCSLLAKVPKRGKPR